MELTSLGASYDLLRSSGDNRIKASDERQAKRLSEMQDALKRLQAMPSPREMAKQNSSNKVGMLKQRLEAMKALMLHASPQHARVLARELKSIAKELSSVAQSLNGGSAQGSASTSAVAGSTTGSADAAEAPEAEVSVALAETDAVTSSAQAAIEDSTADLPGPGIKDGNPIVEGTRPAGPEGSRDGGDQDLRALLQDAKKLLKEIIGMLKAKLALAASEAKAGKEAKEAKIDLRSAEKSLAEMERALSPGGGEALYSALGALSVSGLAEGMSAPVAASGLHVNISA